MRWAVSKGAARVSLASWLRTPYNCNEYTSVKGNEERDAEELGLTEPAFSSECDGNEDG